MKYINDSKLHFYSERVPGKIPVFLVSGKAGVGKTTFSTIAKFILDYYRRSNHNVFLYAFADPIKDCCREFLDWDGEKDVKGRELLQKLGDVGRSYDSDLWVKKAEYFIERNFTNTFGIFIDDWRFANEYEYLKKNGLIYVISIRIVAPAYESLKDNTGYNHISETELSDTDDTYDHIINNDIRTLDDLRASARKVLNLYYNLEDLKNGNGT